VQAGGGTMLKLPFVLAVVAGLAANAPLVREPSPPRIVQQHTQPENISGPIGSSPKTPLYVKANCDKGCGYSEDDKGWWRKLWTDPVATFTALLAGFTIWLAIFTATAARAAIRAANTAERTLTELERPYLFILDFNWVPLDRLKVGGLESGIRYVVTNGGKQPAVIRSVKMGFAYDGSIPADLEEQPAINDLLTAPLVVPDRPRQISQKFTVEDDDRTGSFQLKNGEEARIPLSLVLGQMVVKISIEYDGPVTGVARGYETTACWEWHASKGAFTQHGGAEHNQRT
jgi:hypothetical protein